MEPWWPNTLVQSKSQRHFDLSAYCLREWWSAGSQSEWGLQLLCQLAVTQMQQKSWRDSWPCQMPYSRVQLMPAQCKPIPDFIEMSWLGCHSHYCQSSNVSTSRLQFSFPIARAVVRSVATGDSQIGPLQGISGIQSLRLCMTESKWRR